MTLRVLGLSIAILVVMAAVPACAERGEPEGDTPDSGQEVSETATNTDAPPDFGKLAEYATSESSILFVFGSTESSTAWQLQNDDLVRQAIFPDVMASFMTALSGDRALIGLYPLMDRRGTSSISRLNAHDSTTEEVVVGIPGRIRHAAAVDDGTTLLVRRRDVHGHEFIDLVATNVRGGSETHGPSEYVEVADTLVSVDVGYLPVFVANGGGTLFWARMDADGDNGRWFRASRSGHSVEIEEEGQLPEVCTLVGVVDGRPLWMGPNDRSVWLDGELIYSAESPQVIRQVSVLGNESIVILSLGMDMTRILDLTHVAVIDAEGKTLESRQYDGNFITKHDRINQDDVWSTLVLNEPTGVLAVVVRDDGADVRVSEEWVWRGPIELPWQ